MLVLAVKIKINVHDKIVIKQMAISTYQIQKLVL